MPPMTRLHSATCTRRPNMPMSRRWGPLLSSHVFELVHIRLFRIFRIGVKLESSPAFAPLLRLIRIFRWRLCKTSPHDAAAWLESNSSNALAAGLGGMR